MFVDSDGEKISLPNTWSEMKEGETCKVETVGESTSEYNEVKATFDKSMAKTGVTYLEIKKVQILYIKRSVSSIYSSDTYLALDQNPKNFYGIHLQPSLSQVNILLPNLKVKLQ